MQEGLQGVSENRDPLWAGLVAGVLPRAQPGTFAEKHVPDAQHRAPRQGAGEGTHEPLRHVEQWVDLLPAEVLVGHR